jgi:hypothetical protein
MNANIDWYSLCRMIVLLMVERLFFDVNHEVPFKYGITLKRPGHKMTKASPMRGLWAFDIQ